MSSLSINGLTGLSWAFTGVVAALTVGRYIIRLQKIKRLQWDDALHGLALLVLVGYVATYTAFFPLAYAIEFWFAGLGPTPSNSALKRYFHIELSVTLLFWVCIYAVKFAFLMFYHQLFSVSRNFMKAWWAVFAWTLLTFWVCFASGFFMCGRTQDLFIPEACLSDSTLALTTKIVKFWCVLNVTSDLAIMGLPLYMLRGLHMPKAQKVGLAGLFCIAIIDVIFDILRTINTVDGGAVALDTIWDILEPSIAVIISTLPTYRTLFSTGRKRDKRSYSNLAHTRNPTGVHQHAHELGGIIHSKSGLENGYHPGTSSTCVHTAKGSNPAIVESAHVV